MSMFLDLAERCEKADGASYDLECAIWDAIYPGERQARFDKLTAPGQVYHGRGGPADFDGYVKPLRAFTTSIDAAVTLVPYGFRYILDKRAFADDAVLRPGVKCYRADVWSSPTVEYQMAQGWAHTPALALCAAALRARAAIKGQG